MKLTRTMIPILAASLLSMSCASFCGSGSIESLDEANLSRAGDSACGSSDECEVLLLCYPTLVCKNASDSYDLPTESCDRDYDVDASVLAACQCVEGKCGWVE